MFGYAIGQFLGFVGRKQAVAAVIAKLLAAAVCGAWVPSLIVGGVHLWQWAVPPLLLVAATRLAAWPWATDRLGTWRPAVGLTVAGLVAAAGVAGGVAYRVVEPPEPGDPFDVAAFEAGRPTPEENVGGRAVSQALQQFRQHVARVSTPAVPRDPSDTSGFVVAQFQFRAIEAVRAAAWPGDAKDFEGWLDAVFENGWADDLRAAVRKPPGTLCPVPGPVHPGESRVFYDGMSAGTLLLARSLRQTAAGKVEPALDDIAVALDLCRHLKTNAPAVGYQNGAYLEALAAGLLAPWAEKAVDRPDLIRRAIEMVRKHAAARPSLTNTIRLEYLNILDYLAAPTMADGRPTGVEADLYRAAVQVPWERQRLRGVAATLFAGFLRTAELAYPDALRRIGASSSGLEDETFLLDAWTPPDSGEAPARSAAGGSADWCAPHSGTCRRTSDRTFSIRLRRPTRPSGPPRYSWPLSCTAGKRAVRPHR